MKQIAILLTLTTLFTGRVVGAETTGDAAAASAETAQSSSWQNWTFAAIAAVTAATAIFIVSLDNGHKVQNTGS